MNNKFEKDISLFVDIDIQKDKLLNDVLTRVLVEIGDVLPIDFKRDIRYDHLGLDKSIIGRPPAVIQTLLTNWSSFKNAFHENPKNDHTIMIVLEDLGSSASGGYREINGVKTGIVTLPLSRLKKKSIEEKKDLMRHEILHALGIPHIQGPLSIEGFFDNQSTMPNRTIYGDSAEIFEPNMDPSSTDLASGLQASDLQVLNHFYPVRKKDHFLVSIDFARKGMNCALIGRSRRAPLSQSVAMPTIAGIAEFYVPKGRYAINLRPASVKGGNLSGVWRDGDPELLGEFWFRKRRGNKLIFRPATKDKHRLKTIKLKRDRFYQVRIEDEDGNVIVET